MLHRGLVAAAASAALLLSLPNGVLGIYSKGSPVLQVNAKSYENLIARSNHTSVSCYDV